MDIIYFITSIFHSRKGIEIDRYQSSSNKTGLFVLKNDKIHFLTDPFLCLTQSKNNYLLNVPSTVLKEELSEKMINK